MADLQELAWPLSKAGEALEALARRSGFPIRPVESSVPVANEEQIEVSGSALGLEVEECAFSYVGFERELKQAAPMLIGLPGGGEPAFLAVLTTGRKVRVLAPDLAVREVRLQEIRAALSHRVEPVFQDEVNLMLNAAGIPKRQQVRARQAIFHQRFGQTPMGRGWLLRLPPGASFWCQLRKAGVLSRLVGLMAGHAVYFALWILGWWVLGQGALQGIFDPGWILAWALVLATLVPFSLLTTWLQGRLAIDLGGLLKQRLLFGALQLDPEEVRSQGAGQLLGTVIESEAVESLALTGGLMGLTVASELLMAGAVMAVGAGGWLHVLLLIGWVAFTLLFGWRYLHRHRSWTKVRLQMTHDLVEQMSGNRTRLAQESPERWHKREDKALEHYECTSQELDRNLAFFPAVISRGWMILGILGLAPAFVLGFSSPVKLAIGLGGVLLAQGAFGRLVASLQHLVEAWVSWEQVAPLFKADCRQKPEATSSGHFLRLDTPAGKNTGDATLLEASDLWYGYPNRSQPALKGCDLEISAGDRILLDGASGAGKSTLASLLTGLRDPQSGLVLLGGLDLKSLGREGWRKCVSSAPQFHENHVFSGTFAFNLLMGRRWPARPDDLEEAEAICRDLGLDELLRHMPTGLHQRIGEGGWPLSHGERGRLFIARALLQGADLVVFDESFASLDPATLHRSMQCVLQHSPALLVVGQA